MDKQDKMFGREVSILTYIERCHSLEGIIFEAREALKYYKDGDDRESGYMCRAEVWLKKWDKSWDEIYKEIDKKI